MSTECPNSEPCTYVARNHRELRARSIELRAGCEHRIAQGLRNFGVIIEGGLNVPPDIRQRHAEDTDRLAEATQSVNALEHTLNEQSATLSTIIDDACETCPVRQLNLAPILPPQ